MKEIGGYIELDRYTGMMLHDDGIRLNCGRNALAYLIETKSIKTIWMPFFMCDACEGVLRKRNVRVRYYHIGTDFKLVDFDVNADDWVYVVNFYGQLDENYLLSLNDYYKKIIVDFAHAYYQKPLQHIDTLYTCRKFFGVPDGAILYTDANIKRIIPRDESYQRMNYLLGRYERTATEFYSEYVKNNDFFEGEPIKQMSYLTDNLLHGIDYESVRNTRNRNYRVLYEHFRDKNRLNLVIPDGAFMYPLYLKEGDVIRKKLLEKHIYIPILWPNVLLNCDENDCEFDMANCILPLPVDQRYDVKDMEYIIDSVEELIRISI